MARKSSIDALQNAFAKAEGGLALTPEGNGRINMDNSSLMPSKPAGAKMSSGKPQSPAQHASVEKAARASVMRRRSHAVAGKELKSLGAPMGKGLISGKL